MAQNTNSMASSFPFIAMLWITHFIIDFCSGIFPVYKTIAGFDLTLSAFVAGFCGFIGEASQLFFGRLGDSGKRKWFMLIGLTLSSTAFFLPFAKALDSAWILVFLVMLGSGSFHPNAAGLAGFLNPQDKSTTLAFFASGGALGLALSQICFATIYQFHPSLILILFVPLAVVMIKCSKYPFFDPKTSDKKQSFLQLIFGKLLKTKTLRHLYFTQICNYGFMFALTFYLPDALKLKGAPEWLWKGGGHLLLISGAGITLPFFGKFCHRFGHYQILSNMGFLALALFTIFLIVPQIPIHLLCSLLFLIGATFGSMNPLSVSWGLKIETSHPSTVASLLMGMAWGVADLLTAFSGIITKFFPHYGIQLTLLFMTLMFSLGLLSLRVVYLEDIKTKKEETIELEPS